MTKRARMITLALALLGAGGFALAVQGGQWWSAGGIPIGPFGSVNCFDGDCHATNLEFLGGTEMWLRMATATVAAGLIAMALLIATAGALAAGKAPAQLGRLILVAVATALVAGIIFITKLPAYPGISVDRGIPIFFVAIVLGAVAGFRLSRAKS